jgi:hypothetical protein
MIRLRRSRSTTGQLVTVSTVVVPLIGAWILQLVVPIHQPRYLIGIAPFVFLLAGLGVEQLVVWGGPARIHAAAIGLVLILPWLNLDIGMYSQARYLHAGWRDAVEYYMAHREANDVLIPDPEWQDTTFDYYLQRSGGADAVVLPLYSSSATLNGLHQLQAEGVSGVWTAVAVYAGARDRLGPVLLGVATPTRDHSNNGEVELRRYALDSGTASARYQTAE